MPNIATLTVALGERAYPIRFGEGLRDLLASAVAAESAGGRRLAVVTDSNVRRAASAWFDGPLAGLPVHVLAAGERSKSLAELEAACEFLAVQAIDRGGLLLAVGGGVVGDLAGFAAASYLRGIDYWQVPTTLLAMVDSAVGGKTGVNLPSGKNLVGAFHQPRAVFCDMAVLATLPPREFAAGMAEVIKCGLLGDKGLFDDLSSRAVLGSDDARLPAIVRRCCEIKAGFVEEDERETARDGGRALLNLGHTFAHAIETTAGYGEYLHGEAVGAGLVAAARLSQRLGLVDAGVPVRVEQVVVAHGLPARLRPGLSREALLATMMRDKKVRRGRLRLVVLEAIGRAATRDGVDLDLVEAVWTDLGARDA